MLSVSGLCAFYGKKQVLFDIDLSLRSGSIGAVIGPNGAGKSTVLRAVFGLVPQRQGTVRLEEHDLIAGDTQRCIAAGVAFVPQGARVFRDLSVGENLRMGGFTLSSDQLRARRDEVLEAFPILGTRARQRAGALSGGERQMLAFGMALMLKPRLLLIDEPSIGLAPLMVAQVFETISQIRDRIGTSVMVVEQQARQALQVADSVFVIRAGRLIGQGDAAKFRDPDVLRQVYLSAPTLEAVQQEEKSI